MFWPKLFYRHPKLNYPLKIQSNFEGVVSEKRSILNSRTNTFLTLCCHMVMMLYFVHSYQKHKHWWQVFSIIFIFEILKNTKFSRSISSNTNLRLLVSFSWLTWEFFPIPKVPTLQKEGKRNDMRNTYKYCWYYSIPILNSLLQKSTNS